MSRWGRGRGGSVAVPLDSALFRENSNCPTAARSAGTVGKWGITSFTSLRSAPYAYANNVLKKPVQDQNRPLTVPAVETEQPPPKPKKFFKSRNVEPYPPAPQISYAPPVSAAPLSPEHSFGKKEKGRKAKVYNRDSSSPEAFRSKAVDKTFKVKKGSLVTKASRKEEINSDTQPPNKRYLVRNRNKVVNYAEDGSNSPIPESIANYVPPPVIQPKIQSPKSIPEATSPLHVPPEMTSPTTSTSTCEERKPTPIILRISKGTSRIVSTDSNEGFTSPGSDRHSSLDTHNDYTFDHKKSPSVDSICSPKHEGLKITIKCPTLNSDGGKKEKKKDKKEHKSHKRHHKSSDDEPLKKVASPMPGTDHYDIYKTLSSPVPISEEKTKQKSKCYDDIESKLAQFDSNMYDHKSTTLEPKATEAPPQPKPPEKVSSRARRNRPNINYSENDDYLDAITSKSKQPPIKLVIENKKEMRKNKKKHEINIPEPASQEMCNNENEVESHMDSNELTDILSGNSDSGKSEHDNQKVKSHRKHRHKHHKYLNSEIQSNIVDNTYTENEEQDLSMSELGTEPTNIEEKSQDTQDSGVNEMDTNENQATEASNAYANSQGFCEDDSNKYQEDDVFKSPPRVAEITSEDKPSVKLVITKKKGSIFKSKSLVSDSSTNSLLPARKRRHLYKHEWANDGKGNETPRREPEQAENTQARNPSNQAPEELSRVTRYRAPDPMTDDTDSSEVTQPYTSVRCAKEVKEYYTVVRNVKKAHQIQEIGEFQEINDDIEYLLDAVQDNNPISTRCLSAITLASKCTAPAFRMHLRAHGTVQKFFTALHDATNDQSLGLCTATVMFVLSQDRLNMDLDRESLELMLNLLESDVSHKNALDDCGLTSAQLTKTQERVRELCAEIKSQGKATHLDLDNITVGHLAMETLLSLTSKRAGEWFKEELRVLGGVDHIVRTIHDCAARLEPPALRWDQADIDVLRKADRCMRVLENVTQQNEENQLYLVSGERIGVAGTLASLLWLCATETKRGGPPYLITALLDAALPALKVLVNLSHSFGLTASSLGSEVVGEETSVMEICLVMLHNQGNFVPENRNFEFNVCVLLLLINLVQNNPLNTSKLLGLRIRVDSEGGPSDRYSSSLDLIVDHFFKREELARLAEKKTDAILDGDVKDKDDDKKKQSQDDIDETVAKLLAKAGAHMEHTMVGAYIALLLGHIAVTSQTLAAVVRQRVSTYAPLLPTLKKYYSFLNLTASGEAAIVAHVKSTQRIIEFMESSDKEHVQEETNNYQDMPQDMSLSNLNYNMNATNYSTSSSDRMSSSMDGDSYH